MAIGFPKDMNQVNSRVGELAQSINSGFRRADQFKTELGSFTDTQLTNAGFTTNEVTALRTLASDLPQLATIYRGGATLGTARDFRASLRPAWGVLGDV